MTDLTVSKTILKQLGGDRFISMTGCKDFTGDNSCLWFRVRRNRSRANKIRITLTPADLYLVEAFKVGKHQGTGKTEVILLQSYNDIAWDKLQEVFAVITGMDTHL